MKKVLLALIVLLILYSCNNSHNNGYYSEIDINRQVDSIMGLMTLDEKIGQTILKNPNIIRPHVKVKDITELNFQKMKDMGMDKIIFSRDNTLSNVLED